ncbi:hypothetical protein [Paractinoplanes atraurantiacus]|uniref:FXSXX-COOH protein n=1 Tax=Paractinoplanes atraurantiacus TaxID=1036182 RepID=A0A285JFD5_9ACTN|nr:hypothetical protein [Actinoplanes atraurantiacus]SNY58096.1 hypothetical protein SAMN05421748_1194 [Actinoplanes atraurantiacus]
MTTLAVHAEKPRLPLGKLNTEHLDDLSDDDVSPIVNRIMAAHLDQTRIPAAKFSSFI